MSYRFVSLSVLVVLSSTPTFAATSKAEKKDEPKPKLSAETLAGLSFRSIGPALSSGRISDIAVDPTRPSRYFVASSYGGVFRTTNGGTTFEPIFDGEGSASIGCITLDPNDPLTVWVGTGENNSQRSVGYGDGVYRSTDGGSSWTKMGLENSEHIAKIWIDPRDSKRVLVASQGPLWSDGGDRGLFRSTDGGGTWTKVLGGGPATGVTDLVVDPGNPDVMYAATYQRRRHVWTLINGGPEGGIHKSTDGGTTWTQLKKGLPKGDIGRIGLALAAGKPWIVYATVEAALDGSGFYRSTDAGASWEKRSSTIASSPQYYQELIADPVDADRVYMVDTFLKVTEDGGATFVDLPWHTKHVDEHALWIDPRDTDHLLTGNDGGLYESFDRGQTWRHFPNLPLTQFYKVAVGPGAPFYRICGGTQDNNTQCGPARSDSGHGILSRHWFVATTGDGFEPAIDPNDPDTIYAQAQYGALVRYDHRSGETVGIVPQPEEGEALRWNWDAALLLSPHSPTRLYYGANRLYRSDDRGNSWTAISADLTRDLDRGQLEAMGRVWGVDAVARNNSTSFYGTLVALTESPLVEGLIYTGSDDGLIQITEDGGTTWRSVDRLPGVPARTYVHDLRASSHDPNTVFAALDNHKEGDFTPYVMKSTDRGRTWTSITGDLPKRGQVNTVVQDHRDPNLLFVGTEFGVFFTADGGSHWIRLQGGIPTTPVLDLAIQTDVDDLVVASFGRGFFILDDLTPLRGLSETALNDKARLFPVEDDWIFVPRYELGFPGPGFLGDSLYLGQNLPAGPRFVYHLADGFESRAEARRAGEAKLLEAGKAVSIPSWEALRAEDREIAPTMILTVTDESGRVVRRLEGPAAAGLHRVSWDLREPSPNPASLAPPRPNFFGNPDTGPLVPPGRYRVQLAAQVDGKVELLGEPQGFEVRALGATDQVTERVAFERRTAELQRRVRGAREELASAQERVALALVAARAVSGDHQPLVERALALRHRLADLDVVLNGDRTVARRNEPTTPSLADRVDVAIGSAWATSTAAPPATLVRSVTMAEAAFAGFAADLNAALADLETLGEALDQARAPWTPGRSVE